MGFFYSDNQNIQMLLYLLKANNIRKVIISPGATHMPLAGSLQQDGFFELYSAVDERGAGYMACGMALESGEPVVITCTGATASRNYLPALSEAYYRKLPILAITGAQDISNAGNLIPQFLDRTQHPKDSVRFSVHLQDIKDEKDVWDCNLKINRALLELLHHGGGPVHINLTCNGGSRLNVQKLLPTRVIRRYCTGDDLPALTKKRRIAISVGAHKPWSHKLTEAIDAFCNEHDAVVFVDHSSGYHGRFRILPTLSASQELHQSPLFDIDLLIHIGEQSGDYYTFYQLARAKEVWRVSEDGELRDTFHKLSTVFEMSEYVFFNYYTDGTVNGERHYWIECKTEIEKLYSKIPELPFSNVWMAREISSKLPLNSAIHFGVSNTMRSWTFFELPDTVEASANVGCRGIDGALSTTIGLSLARPDRIQFCVLGDLTFFYNMNALGNRHVGNNLRILLINNGGGAEFQLYQHSGYKHLGEAVGKYVAACGHNGKKSPYLVRHYVEDLGFRYYSAFSKEETLAVLPEFLSPTMADSPMLLEVFTDSKDESDALKKIRRIQKSTSMIAVSSVKYKLNEVLGSKGNIFTKRIIKKRRINK